MFACVTRTLIILKQDLLLLRSVLISQVNPGLLKKAMMKCFVTIGNSFQPLTPIAKVSILDAFGRPDTHLSFKYMMT